ncbi:hypothetical protein JTE90_006190 [Oedothorax gibbosus]|uniref:Uncharacterized protein n=1 Tax=Oedothorax gibbosus TaxID=931172 RepID=A0AAV6VV46_9ARAC|nr:hypothetical protein JTE90_006190 [Oedothorax gibbosus]
MFVVCSITNYPRSNDMGAEMDSFPLKISIYFCHVELLPYSTAASACNSNAIEYPAISMLDGPENQIMPEKVFLGPDKVAAPRRL